MSIPTYQKPDSIVRYRVNTWLHDRFLSPRFMCPTRGTVLAFQLMPDERFRHMEETTI